MNSIHDNDRRDAELVDELKNVEQAYRRLEQPGPPDLLDLAVLNTARRAVGNKPALMQLGWLKAVTTVALFGLAISIILKYPGSEVLQEGDIHSTGPIMPVAEEEQPARRSSKMAVDSDKQPTGEVARFQAEADEVAASARVDAQDLVKAEKTRQSRSEFRAGQQAKETSTLPGEPAKLSNEDRAQQQAAVEEAIATVDIGFRDADETAEDRLAEILNLKEAGNDSWQKKLDAFMTDYPDYELPESLKPSGQ